MERKIRIRRAGLLALVIAAVTAPGASASTGPSDWPQYLAGPDHSSFTTSSAITPSNAASVHLIRSLSLGNLQASPTVVNGVAYVGSLSGYFYAVNLATGKRRWRDYLGIVPKLTCSSRGVTSTAAVLPDPQTGTLTVYVGGGDGYLYALNAATGAVTWKTVVGALPSSTMNDYYNWSSPTVVNGKIYDGVSSECDNPFVPGGVQEFDQHTGGLLNTYYTMPSGDVGGGVWSSVAADGTSVWATTGSTSKPPYPQGESYSMIELDATTLAEDGVWTVPAADRRFDNDFGASPTLFTGTISGTPTPMVGGCNKNGYFYAFQANNVTAGPVWKTRIGQGVSGDGVTSCLAAAIWDGTHLLMGGNPTTINGTSYQGSVAELDPSTGAVIWQTGLGGVILGSPSMDAAGVIAAATFNCASGATNDAYLLNADDGSVLATIPLPTCEYAQPVFADGYLLLEGKGTGSFKVYGP
jgi:outer membrane protein assembly factor BamB